MVAPIIHELSGEYAGGANIGKVDVDHSPKLARAFGIRSIPTILFIKNGVAVDKLTGEAPKREFVKRLDKLVQKSRKQQ
jgi:thioredoxin 1